MLKPIDNLLNKITMYKLVFYGLIALIIVAVIMSFFGIFSFSPLLLVFSTLFIVTVSHLTSEFFANAFGVTPNTESTYITALILASIVNPPKSLNELFFVFWASVLSISSKFIFAINKKHIANPVAIAIFLTALFLGKSATWWVGNIYMVIPVSIFAFLVVQKIRRWDLVIPFIIVAFLSAINHGAKALTDTPLIFFAGIMLTEPLTTPGTKSLRILYGALIGILFYFKTPEIALLIGNAISFLLSIKRNLVLTLKEKVQLAPNIYDFVFTTNNKINFIPGQYMEFTLGHPKVDSRGVRRYFTLANSPTENEIRVGVKFNDNGSSYKNSLLASPIGTQMVAGSLSGDLVLPKDKSKNIVLVAGGIGITPYRSILKYLLDKNEVRPITLIYLDNDDHNFVYKDVFDEAKDKLGIKVIYHNSKTNGHLNAKNIIDLIPNYQNSIFYVSGSHTMVEGFRKILKELRIKNKNIKLDYFSGF